MKIVYFTHSLRSCWNHGNAHFQRGVLRELIARGHDVEIFEPRAGWSLTRLLEDRGAAALGAFHAAYPELESWQYDLPTVDFAALLEDADLVIVHEWNDPKLIASVGAARQRNSRFILLFHDTHHRAVSEAREIHALDLSGYDGILAFGAALAEVYRRHGWSRQTYVWHEAADVRLFKPPAQESERKGLVWIGNWGDGERSKELRELLLAPAQRAAMPLDMYGVNYPPSALRSLRRHAAHYRGWSANAATPDIYARHRATVHVPRRFYAQRLPGIPTIRVFEALACGIPLVCAPWSDSEGLFRPGSDYLVAHDGAEMETHLRALDQDADLRAALAASGLDSIRKRHTCAHRVDELLAIAQDIAAQPRAA